MSLKVYPEVKQTKTIPLSSLYLQLLLFTMILETSNDALKVAQEVFIIERFNHIFWIASVEAEMGVTFSRKFSRSMREWQSMTEEAHCPKVVTVPCRELQSSKILPL